MMDTDRQDPKLLFFRERPKDLIKQPSLISSLQHLETSFILIALGRYPHALVAVGSAIEGTIKAAIKARPDDRLNFKELIKQAQLRLPSFTTISENAIKDFRLKRNEIIHYGYSPKDDEVSANLLLESGYPLLQDCYEKFFSFFLERRDGVFGGLLPEVDRHLGVARRVYARAKGKKDLNFSYCFISLAHQIRWSYLSSTLSEWQDEILRSETEGGWTSWKLKEEQKERLSWHILQPSWIFDCPVCNSPDNFVCELDDIQLNKRGVALVRGACVNCSLVIPRNCPFLADELCKDQLEKALPRILEEYGIV